MKTLVLGSCDIDIFITPESKNSYVEDSKTVAFNLGDKIPVGMSRMTLGGNGANVSVGLKRLSQDVSFYTYLSDDILSRQIKDTIEKEKIRLIDHDQKTKSSSLSLIFDFTSDRIIFSHHEQLNHSFDSSKADSPQALYLTSLGDSWTEAYQNLLTFVQSHPLMLAFSPGSHQLSGINDLIFEIIAVSRILFVNKEEGEKIIEKKGESAKDMKELLEKLSKLGPEIVSVTDGKNGAYSFENGNTYSAPAFDTKTEGVDKTGAGDAYASGFFGATLLGKDIKTAMRYGAANANSVILKKGAQEGLLSQEEIEALLLTRSDFQATSL